jgi:metallo-beta-lactamase family protein
MFDLTFHGAAETVTGSKYLLTAGGHRVLIDCGLFQGLKELRLRNWQPLPFSPADVAAVVLTHAHIDHIGYLPRFVRQGYRGAVYCTPATAKLAELMLYDAAFNQQEDAEYANRKGFSKHRPALPLFDSKDVDRALKLLRPMPRGEWFSPADSVRARYHDTGHLLGSAMIETELQSDGRAVRVLFSGDVGRYNAPLYHDPSPPPACDVLVCESTYGDREHAQTNVLDQVRQVVEESIRRGGVMLVPSFAVGRAQQLIYLLRVLMHDGRLPELPIYLDSPMAIDATNIYRSYRADHDLSEGDLSGTACVFRAPNVHLARTADESKRINEVDGPAVIISSSGMMVGGRILHHLKRRLPDPRNTVVLGGFMAAGTRGRQLKDGARFLRIHGADVPVRAAVTEAAGLSGHAGRSELLRWLSNLPAPRHVYLTHGEKTAAQALAGDLRSAHGWNVSVPALGEAVSLEPAK